MIKKLEGYISDLNKFDSKDINEIESLKIKFLGRKGIINELFSDFKNVPSDQKKEFGQKINELKILAQKKYDAIFCMNDALILGAWQALQAAPSPIDLFGMSETGMPSLLPPTISYAYYSGEAAATETIGLMLKIMREKTPATENSRSISWQERKA